MAKKIKIICWECGKHIEVTPKTPLYCSDCYDELLRELKEKGDDMRILTKLLIESVREKEMVEK